MGQRTDIRTGLVSALTTIAAPATASSWGGDPAEIENGSGKTVHVRYIGFKKGRSIEINYETYERTFLYELVVATDTAPECEVLLDAIEVGLSGKVISNAGPAGMTKHPNGTEAEFVLDNIHGRCAFIQCWALSDIESHALS